jgi:hypothetical protein
MRTPAKLTLCLGLALAFATTAALARKPATKLGHWMNDNISSNMGGDADGFAQIKTNMALVVGKPPPNGSYPKWAEMAKATIAAADKGDLKAVKATCKSCHDAYQDQYIKENLNAPFP